MLLTAVFLAVAGTAFGQAADEKIVLRLRLKEGESYRQRMTTDQKISQTIQGQQLDMAQKMGMEFTYDVLKVNADGTARVKVTYTGVLFEQDGPMGKIRYDSANPPETVHPLAQGFAALVGQGFSMEFTPEGKVTNVEGVDAMLKHMLANMDLPDEATKADLEKKLTEQFGDQAMKEMMENMMATYPDGPVGLEDSWSKKIVVSKGFGMIMENTWTLKARRDGKALVSVTSKVSPNPDAAAIAVGPMKIGYDLSGKQEGTIEIDEATGWTLRQELTQDLSGKVRMEGGPAALKESSWPISLQSTILVETPGK